MKKLFLLLLVALLGNAAIAQITDYSIFDKKFNFYVANDLVTLSIKHLTESQTTNTTETIDSNSNSHVNSTS